MAVLFPVRVFIECQCNSNTGVGKATQDSGWACWLHTCGSMRSLKPAVCGVPFKLFCSPVGGELQYHANAMLVFKYLKSMGKYCHRSSDVHGEGATGRLQCLY